jgi:hypothetical protein
LTLQLAVAQAVAAAAGAAAVWLWLRLLPAMGLRRLMGMHAQLHWQCHQWLLQSRLNQQHQHTQHQRWLLTL